MGEYGLSARPLLFSGAIRNFMASLCSLYGQAANSRLNLHTKQVHGASSFLRRGPTV